MGARILVVEDDHSSMELLHFLLKAFGYAVSLATDGESVAERAHRDRPDLVLCDLRLPGIDGFEVLRRLKADPQTAHLPVVAITACAMLGDRERVLAAGFDGYISKPLDPRSLVPRIAAPLLRAALRRRAMASPRTEPAV